MAAALEMLLVAGHTSVSKLHLSQSSQIGSFDVSVINFVLDALFDNVLLYPTNAYLNLFPIFTFPPIAGTQPHFAPPPPNPLPLFLQLIMRCFAAGFHYVNPRVVYSTNYVTLSADFAVSPQQLAQQRVGQPGRRYYAQ